MVRFDVWETRQLVRLSSVPLRHILNLLEEDKENEFPRKEESAFGSIYKLRKNPLENAHEDITL
jgi:hypothetical protein